MAARRAAQRVGFFNFHTVPPVKPPFPEEIHLRKVCGIVWCIDASDEDAEKAMAPMLSVAEPLMHGVGRMPIRGAEQRLRRPLRPGRPVVLARRLLREIPDEAITRNREWNERMPGFKAGSHLYPVDGAANDVPVEDTAFAYRDATWSQVFIGCDPDPASARRLRDWTIGYRESIIPYSAGGRTSTS